MSSVQRTVTIMLHSSLIKEWSASKNLKHVWWIPIYR